MNRLQKAIATITRIPIRIRGDNTAFYDHIAAQRVAGEVVTRDSALGIAAVWACVNLLAGCVGSMPMEIRRPNKDGTPEVDKSHPLYNILHCSPNADQTALDFWELMQACLELDGNAYAEKLRGVRDEVIALEPIHPGIMQVSRSRDDGSIKYVWRDASGQRREETDENILHIRGALGGPLGGASTISACARTFALGQAANKSAATLYENGARPSGTLSTDMPLDKAQRTETELLLQQKFVGAVNAGRPMLLDNGLKWTQLSLSAEDAQIIETRRFSTEEVCQIFGTPPHMIGYTTSTTSFGKGLTEQTHGFQKFTLRRRFKRIEQALEKQVLTPKDRAEGVTIRFNLNALLRGVASERATYYASGLDKGWFTINEVRALEGMPPVDGGDVPRIQMQNVPLLEANNNTDEQREEST